LVVTAGLVLRHRASCQLHGVCTKRPKCTKRGKTPGFVQSGQFESWRRRGQRPATRGPKELVRLRLPRSRRLPCCRAARLGPPPPSRAPRLPRKRPARGCPPRRALQRPADRPRSARRLPPPARTPAKVLARLAPACP